MTYLVVVPAFKLLKHRAKPSFSKHVAHKPRLDPALVFCKQTADLFLFTKNVLLIIFFCYHPILTKLCEIEVVMSTKKIIT